MMDSKSQDTDLLNIQLESPCIAREAYRDMKMETEGDKPKSW